MGYWTIAELAEQAAAVLARDDRMRTLDSRTRGVPDPRTIRWYQTTGLIDRPTTMRGRTALYGERHLAQLVAIKRLQANGRSLAAIQAELAGASDDVLGRLAALPERPPQPVPGSEPAQPTTQPTSRPTTGSASATTNAAKTRPRFWTARATAQTGPAARRAIDPNGDPNGDHSKGVTTPWHGTEPPARPSVIHGLPLAPGVVLLVEGNRAPDGADTDALLRAAEPLLAELTSRALLEEER